MNIPEAYSINKKLIAQNFSRAANRYRDASFLQQEIAARLLERIEVIESLPSIDCVLDLGGGIGLSAPALAEKFKDADIVNLDLSQRMLVHSLEFASVLAPSTSNAAYLAVCGDAEVLPFKDASFDLIYSNCVFHWCFNLDSLLKEIKRVLKQNGVLIFSMLGQDTLKELRICFEEIDQDIHVNPFLDMHIVGDALVQNHFIETVMDQDILVMSYKNVLDILKDIKNLGGNSVQRNNNKGLNTKIMLKKLQDNYEMYRKDSKLPATFEVIYGYARV